MNKNMKRWIKILSKIERTLINKEVWGIADLKIKVEKEDVTGKGDITRMKRWHEKKLFLRSSFCELKRQNLSVEEKFWNVSIFGVRYL